MKRITLFAILAVLLAAFLPLLHLSATTAHAASRTASAHHHIVIFPTRQEWYRLHGAHAAGTPQGSGDLAWNGGPVQHYPVTYEIFWGPGWSNGAGGVTADGQVVENYFNDLGGTSFENILTQYYDSAGNVVNTHTVGGIWLDTSTPPTDSSCGGSTVQDSSIQSEVSNAIAANGWPADGSNAIYFVYTANGYYVNDGTGSCSEQTFCAYHNWSNSNGVAYAAMPYPMALNGCGVPNSPNGNAYGDSLASVTSHEQFEAVTDPQPSSGWVDAAGYEIGDKCAWDFSAGYTYLNYGGTFEVQTEYSNATSSCVNSY